MFLKLFLKYFTNKRISKQKCKRRGYSQKMTGIDNNKLIC